MKAVKLTKLVQEMNLKNLTPEVDMEHVRITLPDINRPALQLTGYFEHFASERVQIIGLCRIHLSDAPGSGTEKTQF